MKIALDYDGTYTRDHELWDTFAHNAIANGHDVKIVSMRSPDQPIPDVGLPVIYTSCIGKLRYLAVGGWIPDVWIDDKPQWILT